MFAGGKMSLSVTSSAGFDFSLLMAGALPRGMKASLAGFGSTADQGSFLSALTRCIAGAEQGAGLSVTGRNPDLFDPESAYRMMTAINRREVGYKAEFAEMRDMGAMLDSLRGEALALGGVDAAMDGDAIRLRVQEFAAAYNRWIDRFDQGLAPGGLLAGTQAAQVSHWELEQSVESLFNGVRDGLHGMRDLGVTIDAGSDRMHLDSARLDAVLAKNRAGAIGTLRDFSANFARSAELLNAPGNFIPNRLDKLDRVIDYLHDNDQALHAEFGLGDAPRPTGEVARALAVYNAIYSA